MIAKIKYDDPRLKELLDYERTREFMLDHAGFVRLARTGDLWGFIENGELLAATLLTKQIKTYTSVATVTRKDKRAQKIAKELLSEVFKNYSNKPIIAFVHEKNLAVRKLALSVGSVEGAIKDGIVELFRPVPVSK